MSKAKRASRLLNASLLDVSFFLAGIALLLLFTIRYQMPFRLDDVLHMEWVHGRSFFDAWHPVHGEIVRSVRPMFAATIWLLTTYAGTEHYFPWHFTLVASFLIGLWYTGLTARYISQNHYALQIATLFYWLAFSAIVNVLFWYGDLTYTIEIMFLGPAWYYGLRGLLEGSVKRWALAMVLASAAVMSKEPAIVLLHGVVVSVGILRYREVKRAWAGKTWYIAVLLYVLFTIVTAYVYLASPTKSNRFFGLADPQLQFFMTDRLRYYGSIVLAPGSRLLLFTPFMWATLSGLLATGTRTSTTQLALLVVSALFTYLFVTTLPIALLLLFVALAVQSIRGDRATHLLLPFAIGAAAIVLALLFTVTLSKTQLNEFALTLLVPVGWAWARVIEVLQPLGMTVWTRYRTVTIGLLTVTMVAGLYLAIPSFAKKEQMLSDVRDVRANANDAIKWSAKHLPRASLLAVMGPLMHGIKSADEMTSMDDATKLRMQYTFLQGYVYFYLRELHRPDIRHAYLEDTVLVPRVLDSMRVTSDTYLLLQTEPDYASFHRKYRRATDSLVAKFDRGPYPAEVWKLQR